MASGAWRIRLDADRPASPHFGDQAGIYSKCPFRDAGFYKGDVLAHATRRYHPDDRIVERADTNAIRRHRERRRVGAASAPRSHGEN